MKKLSIEEKAKRYDEALINGSRLWECGEITRENYEYLFHEPKESEDERIRKELIEYIKDQQSSFISAPDCRDKYEEEENNKYNSWIAWLEKQGEKIIPEYIDKAALQYVDTCAVDGKITHNNVTEPYWNNHSMMNAYKAGWFENKSEQILANSAKT